MGKKGVNCYHDPIMEGISEMFAIHQNQPACWYHVNHIDGSDRNLSDYFGWNKHEYYEVLSSIGATSIIKRKDGSEQRRHTIEPFRRIVNEYKIPHCEFEIKQVSAISAKIRHLYWVRLGQFRGLECFDALQQGEDVKKFCFEHLERRSQHAPAPEKKLFLGPMILFLARGLLQINEEIEIAKCAEGEDAIDFSETDGISNSSTINSTSATKEEQQEEDVLELDATKYPNLSKFGSIMPSHLNDIQREIVAVSKEFPDKYRLTYVSSQFKEREMIIIPQVSTHKSFQVNVDPILQRLPKLLVSDFHCRQRCAQEMITSEEVHAEEAKRMTHYIIDYFCRSQTHIFVKAAQSRNLDFTNKVMEPEMAAAMFAEAGIGVVKSRVLNRYLTGHFGRRIMPPEKIIFRQDLAHDDLPPEVQCVTLDSKIKLHYFVKPFAKVIALGLQKQGKAAGEKAISKIDLCWSADHGGGYFRAVTKCKVRFVDRTSTQFIRRIGQMKCKSDKYDVVMNTMGPELNDGLCSMLEEDGLTPREIKVYYKEHAEDEDDAGNGDAEDNVGNRDGKYHFITGLNLPRPNWMFVSTIQSENIRIAVTGDLAFYATMLGKPNMSAYWCVWCKLSSSQWSKVENTVGELWTRCSYNAMAAAVLANPRMNKIEMKGVRNTSVLNIHPLLFIPPPLHIKLGLVNRAFIKSDGCSYFSWSKQRVDNIPAGEITAYNLLQESYTNLADREEDVRLFEGQHRDGMTAVKERIDEINLARDIGNYNEDDEQEFQLDKSIMEEELKEYKDLETQIKKDTAKARAKRTLLNKAYSKEKKKRDYRSNLVQNQKESLLREIGVDRGAAHGGDLQGRGCTNLLQNADTFFDKCLQIDLIAVREGTALASEEEVRIMNDKFKTLAILLERLFSFMMMDHDAVEDYGQNFKQDVADHIAVLIPYWGSLRLSLLGAKFHCVKDHLIGALEYWGALGPYNEEFAESDHTQGNAETRQYGALRNVQRRESSISQREALFTNEKVMKVKEEFSPSRKRKNLTSVERDRIKRRRTQVYYACKTRFDAGGFDEIENYYKSSQRDQQQN